MKDHVFIKVDDVIEFIVHFVVDDNRAEGSVYPIHRWKSAVDGSEGWSYDSIQDGGSVDVLSEECRCEFEFSYCWRGVWEGRIYFKDSEYWSEELKVMSDLWDELEPEIKARIRESCPHAV